MRRFGFLVHPLTPLHRRVSGVRRGHFSLARDGEAGIEAVGLLAEVHFETPLGAAAALLVGVPDLGAVLAEHQERARVHRERAAWDAHRLGAEVIGLGNALAVVAGRGARLAQDTGLPICDGHAATAWTAMELTRQAAARHGQGAIGVLGFKGAVGEAVAAGLAAQGYQVWVEASGARTDRRAREVGATPLPLAQILAHAPILVGAATTGPTLDPHDLHDGTVLIDLSLPPTLASGALPKGVRIYAGETLTAPGAMRPTDLWGHAWLALAGYGRGRVYACLAEPMVLALAGQAPPPPGRRLEAAAVAEMGRLLTAAGFRPALTPASRGRSAR